MCDSCSSSIDAIIAAIQANSQNAQSRDAILAAVAASITASSPGVTQSSSTPAVCSTCVCPHGLAIAGSSATAVAGPATGGTAPGGAAFYAVFVGRSTGVFSSLALVQALTTRVSGNTYHKFNSREEAEGAYAEAKRLGLVREGVPRQLPPRSRQWPFVMLDSPTPFPHAANSHHRAGRAVFTRAQLKQAVRIQVDHYDLESALQRKAASAFEGEDVSDEELEFEDEIDPQDPPADPSPKPPPLPEPNDQADGSLPGSHKRRLDKKKADKRRKDRSRRKQQAEERRSNHGLKPISAERARNADPLPLPTFSTTTLPVASTAFTGSRGTVKLSPSLARVSQNLQILVRSGGLRLLNWDGRSCIVFVDREDRIVLVLGGVPPGAQGEEWDGVSTRLTEAIKTCADGSTFTKKEVKHGRGDFIARVTGIGYGGGRDRPGNFRISGNANKDAMHCLMHSKEMERVVGWANTLFNAYAHKIYVDYANTLNEHLLRDPQLRPPSSNTAFAATTVNFGPQSASKRHRDAGNRSDGWCAVTSAGKFNPDEGGHLILWDLRYIIRFPPGATILFPSALITHSNIPVHPGETCYSVVQYSSGGLFRWRYNGWCSDKTWFARATREQKEKREEDRKTQWKEKLEHFTKWTDLLTGSWDKDELKEEPSRKRQRYV